MKDPVLPQGLFRRDRLTATHRLAGPQAWRCLGQARGQGVDVVGPTPLRLRLAAPDLAGVDALQLGLHNLGEHSLLAGLYLCYGTPGRPPLAFSGGRAPLPLRAKANLVFHDEDFGTYGQIGPLAGARWLELVLAREKGEAPGMAKVRLGELWGQARSLPPGPRLTAKGVACRLRPPPWPAPAGHGLDHPGLWLPPPHQLPRSSPDDLLAGRLLGQEIGYPWDWGADPLRALEWRHFLHRHHDLRTLALAWARSGQSRHLRALRRLLATWIRAHPVPVESNGGAGPAWETLSTAWRIMEWLWVRGLAWADLGPGLQNLMRRSVWEHARHLCDHQGHPNNWALLEAAALALAGLAWPEFTESEEWTSLGLRRLAAQCRRQFNRDGSHVELSPLYQAFCLQALLLARRACLAAAWPWPRAAQAALARGLTHLAGLARPDFSWPALNDSGGALGDYAALMAWAGQDLGRPVWRWLGSHGQEGRQPRMSSRLWLQAGLAILRGGRPPGDMWLLLRAAPPGLAHGHADGLSLEVHAGGPRVVDPGISSYAPSPLTTLYRGAGAHSQPLLDGLGASPGPGAIALHRWPGLQLAIAQAATPGGAILSRWLVMVGGRYALVWDRVWGLAGEHEWRVGWQMFPGRWRRLEKALEAADGFGLRLLHAPAGAALDLDQGRRRPLRGWVSLAGADTPAPHWRLAARGTLPMQALWLLAPDAGYSLVDLRVAWGQVSMVIGHPGGQVDRLVLAPAARPPARLMTPGRTWRKNCP
ncbi:MAG: heparinase II/III family protein [Desulfarculus sp.]|nr:heparinase II/III family protein [Desulfarculus sp.]